MYANYETLALKTIDHRLEAMLNAKVNKFITVGLGGILLYDFDQDSGAQFSQLFNFGFSYSFQNYEEKK
jgi:type IV secretory pathway TrbL component